jgi:hypothetical protein
MFLVDRFHEIYLSSFRDVFRPAIAGRSAGYDAQLRIGESIAPAVVMDSGLADAALRASHAPRDAQLRIGNDECCWWSLRTDMIRISETLN